MKKSLTLLASAMLLANNAYAEDATSVKSLWKASAELGFVSSTGNTETETLNAKAKASTDRKQWRHVIEATSLYSSDAISTTAQKFTLSGKSDYKLEGGKNFLFGRVAYENEKFSGYEYRVTEVIGYGRRIFEDDIKTLDLEIGPGLRQSKFDNGDTEDETLLRAAAIFDWNISKSSKFGEELTVETGDDVTITKSVTSLSSQIDGNLSMKVTFTYKNTSDVPVGVDDTDTETAVTLVYNF